MALMRMSYRNPWNELDALSGRLNRLFDEFPTPTETGNWIPAVNVEESAEALVLTAELPGMKLDDLELEVENNVLTIRGEKSEVKTEGEERKYHLWERRFGSFQRSFTLPRTVKPEEITAEFVDGILHVHLPKVAEARSRRIQIKPASGS
jgi:HSP20 family protein